MPSSSPGFSGLFGTIQIAERRHKRQSREIPKATKPSPPPEPAPPSPQQPAQYSVWVFQTLTEYFRGDIEKAIEFMRAHAGCTLVIPVMQRIEQIAMERQIIREVERDPSPEAANRLAQIHNVPRRIISKIVKRTTGTGVAARRKDRQHCRHIRLSRHQRIRV